MLQIPEPTKQLIRKLFDEYELNQALVHDLKEHENPQSHSANVGKGKKSQSKQQPSSSNTQNSKSASKTKTKHYSCQRCGDTDPSHNCAGKNATCSFCKKKGNQQNVCLQKVKGKQQAPKANRSGKSSSNAVDVK